MASLTWESQAMELPRRKPVEKPSFRLRTRLVFWRLAFLIFLVMELVLWLKVIRPNVPFRPRVRRIVIMLYMSPGVVLRAMAVAAVATLVIDVVFRALVKPLMVRWYQPRNRGESGLEAFHFLLEAGERIEQELPARMVVGRKTVRGTLVRTDRRIAFEPFAWDREAWTLARKQVASVSTVTPRRRVLGLVSGYPDHVEIKDQMGWMTSFAVADPSEVLVWFTGKRPRVELTGQD